MPRPGLPPGRNGLGRGSRALRRARVSHAVAGRRAQPAVAISMSSGPAAALPLVEQLVEFGALDRYHLLHAVRGDLLAKLGQHADAAAAFGRGAALVQNAPERELLLRRAAESAERATAGP